MLPRDFVLLALLLASSATAVGCHTTTATPKVRKTVSFGFNKPHSKFVAFGADAAHLRPRAVEGGDVFQLAESFTRTLLPEGEQYGLRIRKDSYTDSTTGVTHVYLKQMFRGFDVVDGDVNVNIKDGAIISYGSEFYHPEHFKKDQIPLTFPEPEFDMPDSDSGLRSLKAALFNLMKRVTPNDALAGSMEEDPLHFLEKMHIHFEHSLVDGGEDASPQFMVTGVPDALGHTKARLVWAQTPNGLKLAWKVNVEMTDNYYESTISVDDPANIFSVVDWVSDSPLPFYLPTSNDDGDAAPLPPCLPATDPLYVTPNTGSVDPQYNVFEWGINDPEEGNRTVTTFSKDGDILASPYGWHTVPVSKVPPGLDIPSISHHVKPTPKNPKEPELARLQVTVGNNVLAQENYQGRNEYLSNHRPNGGGNMTFDFHYHPNVTEDGDRDERMKQARKHINATITQLFYTTNMFHDMFYRYGFTEEAGNFQAYNFGRGGNENDPVIANAQDGSGFNNANFMTPPDGQSGRMRMYLWNTADPYRDGDFEAGIVVHELAHGLSTRLTGGPQDSSCLGFGESGGMGEGWGDFLATVIRSTANYSDYSMGSWASNLKRGIRNYPYSLDHKVNPETYKSVDNYFGVHPIGEVWAEILWVVENKLVEKYGYGPTLFPPAPLEDGTIPDGDYFLPATENGKRRVPKYGNTLMVQLVVDGMKLQKCRPGFIEARDAIIQADDCLTGGENYCLLWEGFADRGLGKGAKVVGRTPWGGGVRTNGFDVPPECQPAKPEPPKDEPKPVPDPKPEPDDPEDEEPDWPWAWGKWLVAVLLKLRG